MNAPEQHLSKIRPALKELLPAYIIDFALCFMLFVFEPLLMYSTNQLDFWFDLALMGGPMLVCFGVIFAGSAVLLTGIYLINKAIARKKEPVFFRILIIILSVVFLATYIQGNFLAGSLPALDGAVIDWDSFGVQNIITAAVWLAITAAVVVMLIKLGTRKTLRNVTFAACGVFLILTITLVASLISWNSFRRKDSMIATNENFNTVSEDKNFIILLNDAIGSTEFNSVLEENPEYKKVFEDFTYFPDTLGCYPCTRDTIPVVLGGALNLNEKEFEDFSSETYNNSPFFAELAEKNYTIDLYDAELVWYGTKNYSIENSTDYHIYNLPLKTFLREEMKYIRFKFLPYFLKKYSDIESMDFNGLVDKYIWDDHTLYGMIDDTPRLKKTAGRSFRFIHTEGAHIPFKYDKDLNILDGYGTYEQKIEATIKLQAAYLERLKENGAYDNSVIVIMADHGNTNLNTSTDMLVRANPMFMVKGVNEHHEFAVSDKPLSYLDLMDIYSELLDDKSAVEATAHIPDERERIYIWYRNFLLEYHMEEYSVKCKAWEWRKFTKTGREFDL